MQANQAIYIKAKLPQLQLQIAVNCLLCLSNINAITQTSHKSRRGEKGFQVMKKTTNGKELLSNN